MPIKPWTMRPKQSLGIFEGLSGVLDARDQRQAQEAQRQVMLEDRLEKQRDHAAADHSRTIEDALHQAQADALKAKPTGPKIIGQKEDPTTGEVFNLYDDGTAQPVRRAGVTPSVTPPVAGGFQELPGGLRISGPSQAPQQQQPTPPVPTLRLGVKPEKKERHTQLVQNDKGEMVVVDLDTGLGPDGRPVKAYHEPKDASTKNPLPAEFEKKADFMLEGAKTAAETLKGYVPKPRSLISKVPFAGNYGLTEEDQVAQNAAETLHDAYLRLTTGATINKDELARAAKQYIAQPGDGPRVLAAKQQRREQVIRALERAASSVRRPGDAPAPQVPRSAPAAHASAGTSNVLAKYGLTPPPARKP